jgi:uncharacterized protein (DUF1778 family)
MDEERTVRVELRLTPEEYANCVEAANATGIVSLAPFIRWAALKAAREALAARGATKL